LDKRQLSERDICTKFITPALRQAGWDEMTQLREEVSFTKGRIIVRGKLVIGPAIVKADCYRFKVHPGFCSRFALYNLNSPTCQRLAAAHHHGMTLVRIGLGNFRRIPIPVPSLLEQQRIVAKLDQLMAACDRLEARLSTAESEHAQLLEAVLHHALNSASASPIETPA